MSVNTPSPAVPPPPTPSAPSPPLPMFVSLDTLAALLDLNRKTVYAAARRGMIPGVQRIGRAFRAHLPTVISWFSAGSRTDRTRGRS